MKARLNNFLKLQPWTCCLIINRFAVHESSAEAGEPRSKPNMKAQHFKRPNRFTWFMNSPACETATTMMVKFAPLVHHSSLITISTAHSSSPHSFRFVYSKFKFDCAGRMNFPSAFVYLIVWLSFRIWGNLGLGFVRCWYDAAQTFTESRACIT